MKKDNAPVRLLFVDDEQIMREGLSLTVDWNAYHFEVAGLAANGKQALALMEQSAADIVVTDIRMPVMDGLALTKELAARYPGVKIVILSAYDEFEYAQQALRYGASEYLLKADMDCDSLLAVALRLSEDIARDRSRQRASEEMMETVQSHLSSLRENFFLGLLTQVCNLPETVRQLEALGLAFSPQNIVLLHLAFDKPCPAELPAEWAEAQLTHGQAVRSSPTHYILVGNLRDGDTPAAAAGRLRSGTDVGCSVFYQSSFDGFENVLAHNGILMEHFRLHLFFGRGGAVCCDLPPDYGAKPSPGAVLPAVIRQLEHNAIVKACETAGQAVRELSDAVTHPDEVKEFLYMLVYLFLEKAQDCAPLAEAERSALLAGLPTGISLHQAVFQYSRFHPLAEDCLGVLRRITQYVSDRLYPYSRLVGGAVDYIGRHLHEELTLNTVAGEIFCSAAYLSHLFKKETGKNFSEYLTASRVQKAKLLLATTALPIREIAERVGIPNPSYFSKVFMKAAGMQPYRYRAEQTGGEPPV